MRIITKLIDEEIYVLEYFQKFESFTYIRIRASRRYEAQF